MDQQQYYQDSNQFQQPVYQEQPNSINSQLHSISLLEKSNFNQKQINQNYTIFSIQNLIKIIFQQVQQLSSTFGISQSWAIQLYDQCAWSLQFCYKLLDQKQSFKQQIKYTNSKVQVIYSKQNCQICQISNNLLKNVCGHSFCLNCWESNSFQKMKQFQLFSLCLLQNCKTRMNYDIVKKIFEKNKYYQMKFNQIICKKYVKKNKYIKMCPQINCKNIFQIKSFQSQFILCQCGKKLCIYCGQSYHKPADCFDYKNWIKIYYDSQNKWIEIISYKLCPHCKEPVQKNQGCNHMTCKCGGQFCWICGKNWKTHNGYNCPYREENDRLQQMRKRKLENQKQYRQKFQQTASQFKRGQYQLWALKNFNIQELRKELEQKIRFLNTRTLFLKQIGIFIMEAVSYIRWGYVKVFLSRKCQQLMLIEIKKMELLSQKTDNFLRQYISELLKLYESKKITQQEAQKQFEKKKVEIMEIKSEGVKYLNKILKERI